MEFTVRYVSSNSTCLRDDTICGVLLQRLVYDSLPWCLLFTTAACCPQSGTSSSVLTVFVGWQDGYPARKKTYTILPKGLLLGTGTDWAGRTWENGLIEQKTSVWVSVRHITWQLYSVFRGRAWTTHIYCWLASPVWLPLFLKCFLKLLITVIQ